MPSDEEARRVAARIQIELASHLDIVMPALEKVADLLEEAAGPGGNRVGAMLGTVLGALCQRYGAVNVRQLLFSIARNEQFWRMQIAEELGPAGRPRI